MIEAQRILALNTKKENAQGEYILYWMQSSLRTRYNHALVYAINKANEQKLPLIVFFQLIDNYPEANTRHYTFVLESLRDIEKSLSQKKISFFVGIQGNFSHITLQKLAQKAFCTITDRGYTRFIRDWKESQARKLPCPLIQVESDIVVPVETASPKEEYSAATLRRKLHEKIPSFLKECITPKQQIYASFSFPSLDLSQPIETLLTQLSLPVTLPPSPLFHGGEKEAQKHLTLFLTKNLSLFAQDRNDPSLHANSNLSPYLHFGNISPLEIALTINAIHPQSESSQSFLEELIVRRELAINFVFYNHRYDTFACLPDWAHKTLTLHKEDPREYLYSRDQLEQAKTHDPYWNSAQQEMRLTGKMHGYMRMYWGKKILEWSKTPEEAFKTALSLNNIYELDGRDPNGFAGVAWCFGKHDRPWKERPIFGMIRYMNAKGLERKFNMSAYVKKVQSFKTSL